MKLSNCVLAATAAHLVASQPGLSCPNLKLPSAAFAIPGYNATYDYVVIGGGTAGNVIAERLAAQPGISVAVIEAGGFYEVDNGNLSVVPGLGLQSVVAGSPLVDWGYSTTPQAGAAGRKIDYPRGKTLGGSSARNLMVYQRGTVGSYQVWADAVGDDSYTFDNFLTHFKDTTHFTPPDFSKRQPNATVQYDPTVFDNSLKGPLQVSYSNWAYPAETWIDKALTAVGIAPNDGFNGGKLIGHAWSTQAVDPVKAERSSSQVSFLNEAICSSDIHIYTRALAEKILFGSNKTATGVLVTTDSKEYVVTARKEVILSAGALNSPQLLLLSGIGDPAILNNFDIPVVSPLKGVGQGMWEHPLFSTAYKINVETSSRLSDPVFAAEQTISYLTNQTGMLAAGTGILGWENVPQPYRSNLTSATKKALAAFPEDWPEIEYLPIDGFFGDAPDDGNYVSLAFGLVAPLSRGNVTISSSSAADLAIVNPNWLTDPADVEVAIVAFKRTQQIWAALKEINPSLLIGNEILAGYSANITSDAEIVDFLRQVLSPIYHPSSTNKMGKKGDTAAVVDTKGRVFGVSGLRVVDASIFPVLPPGHPQATVYALASKIAADILSGN